jgi:hypothetical protein
MERKLRHPDGKVAPVGVGGRSCGGVRGDNKGASGSRDCLSFFFFFGFVGNIQNLISVATPQPLFFQKQARSFELRFIENSFFGFLDFVRSNHDPSLLHALEL